MKTFICTLTEPLKELTIKAEKFSATPGGLIFTSGLNTLAFIPYEKIILVKEAPKS